MCVWVVSSDQLRRLLTGQHGLGELTGHGLLEVLRQDGLSTANAAEIDARRDGNLLLQSSELTAGRRRIRLKARRTRLLTGHHLTGSSGGEQSGEGEQANQHGGRRKGGTGRGEGLLGG
jgi:hypothetical protein